MTDDIRNRIAEVLKSSAHKWGLYDFDPDWDYSSESEAITDAILEAFDVTEKDAALSQPEQAEEWEYCYRSLQTGNRWGSGSLTDAQLGAQAIEAVIERRRKAGSWMPVEEGESDE